MINQRFFNSPESNAFNSLFMLIEKNRTLKEAVDAINPQDEAMSKLLAEIKQGRFSLDSFSHKNCDIFLLRLFKDNNISYPVFLTTYTYLMALIEGKNLDGYQYEGLVTTDDVRPVETFNLWDDDKNQLSQKGEIYVSNLCANFVKLGDFFSTGVKRLKQEVENNGMRLEDHLHKQLGAFISKLHPAERMVIMMKLPFNEFADQIVSGYPYVFNKYVRKNLLTNEDEVTDIDLYTPSYSIHEWLSKQICNEPMKLQACFGRLTRETLLAWHQNNIHPYPIVNRYVKYNLTEAHADPWGPFTISQHDIGHIFYAASASKEDREQFLTLSRFYLTLRDQLDKNPGFNQLLKNFFDKNFDILNDLVIWQYENDWRGDISSGIKYEIVRAAENEFGPFKGQLYQYFYNLNKEKHPEPIQIVIKDAISTLESKYPELREQAKRADSQKRPDR